MITIALLFLLIGLAAGVIGSLVGIGGGLFFVPALLYVVNYFYPGEMTPQLAAGTSLFVIVITALSSTRAFLKQKLVDKQSAWLFFIGSAPGAITGVYLNKMLAGSSFSLAFGLFQIAMFVLMLVKDKLKPRTINWDVHRTYTDRDGVTYHYGYKRWVAIVLAFLVGNVSSLFGVGGGVLMVPIMLVLFRFPPHMATATSMYVIFLSALVGSVTNVVNHHVDWLYVLTLAPGAWIGGKLGAILASRLKGKTLVLMLRVLILCIAIQMIAEYFME
ncbi:MAG: sulfite exporter TauE/SafE family protein [Clostridia bacterium]